jgi:hypothetical protein
LAVKVYGGFGTSADLEFSAVLGESSANASAEHSAVNDAAVIVFSSMDLP